MNTKYQYTAPRTSVVQLKTAGILQSASVHMQVYRDTETTSEDPQYTRRNNNIWDDDDEL